MKRTYKVKQVSKRIMDFDKRLKKFEGIIYEAGEGLRDLQNEIAEEIDFRCDADENKVPFSFMKKLYHLHDLAEIFQDEVERARCEAMNRM